MQPTTVNTKARETQPVSGITHKFACVSGGIRTQRLTHAYGPESVNVIAESPTDVTLWLMLADRLQEEGNEAHHVIRYLFSDGVYEMPKNVKSFSITRGSSYWENGSTYTESAYVKWSEADKLQTSYYSGGGWGSRSINLDEARAMITASGGQHCKMWRDIAIELTIKATRFRIPAGTEVWVKQKSEGDKHYPTKTHTTKEELILTNPDVNFASVVGFPDGFPKFVVSTLTPRIEVLG